MLVSRLGHLGVQCRLFAHTHRGHSCTRYLSITLPLDRRYNPGLVITAMEAAPVAGDEPVLARFFALCTATSTPLLRAHCPRIRLLPALHTPHGIILSVSVCHQNVEGC